ncbi:hypothetical protein BDV96DRAFT_587510 [Lophiotrema nucula]|uniref:Glycosyl hydrolase n=1 Tax=Lophiotrema nucula TaxID=690887 RepID=A0A6A5YMH5_9PLEO|nr:hypothetical protein BDV96DRAFT_587510 [Lophiotrema nucula]
MTYMGPQDEAFDSSTCSGHIGSYPRLSLFRQYDIYNPVLPGWHSDPSCARVNDTFYYVASTFEVFPGLPI